MGAQKRTRTFEAIKNLANARFYLMTDGESGFLKRPLYEINDGLLVVAICEIQIILPGWSLHQFDHAFSSNDVVAA